MTATCTIVLLSFITNLSASATVVDVAEVPPSRIFSSSGVEVIAVVLAAARTGIVPETFGKFIVLSAVGSTTPKVVSLASAVAPSRTNPPAYTVA